MSGRRRLDCPTCGRDVAVRRVTKAGYFVLYDHRKPTGASTWCPQGPFQSDERP